MKNVCVWLEEVVIDWIIVLHISAPHPHSQDGVYIPAPLKLGFIIYLLLSVQYEQT